MTGPTKRLLDLPKPVDVQNALVEALDKLEHTVTEYALIGGVALGVHGIERFTKGVDLAVTEAGSAAAARALPDADPTPLKIGGISFAMSKGVRVDLIDRRFEYRALFEEVIREAKKDRLFAKADRHEVPVVPLHYLVALKLAADRPQDEADLQNILRKDELDYPRAREIVHRHIGHFAARRLDRAARALRRKDAPEDYENGDS